MAFGFGAGGSYTSKVPFYTLPTLPTIDEGYLPSMPSASIRPSRMA